MTKDNLTVKQVIDGLKKFPESAKVVAFTDGKLFPILNVNSLDGENKNIVELGCGWVEIEEDELI